MFELNNFDSIQIGVASPEKIHSWSNGEVTKPETINYRTQKPEKDGLFCERIFGPTKDWECHCGKYKRIRHRGVVCDKCGVEVTKARVRRERMGHIQLASPVSHIWYFRGTPSRISIALDMALKNVEHVLYFNRYVVIDPGNTSFEYRQVIDDREYREAYEIGDVGSFKARMGAEAIKTLLEQLDLEKESVLLKELCNGTEDKAPATGQKRVKAVKRLEVIEAFRNSGNRPEWMILDVIPVLPPEIRPMVQLDGGRFATSDLNDLYRRVINRNNRLKKLMDLGAPDLIVRNEKRMLQEAVDALIDNGRRGKAVTGPGTRELKSLSAMLKGKQGRFRQNLLGKRVDYSGRSVIVVGPELKMYQCGLPKEMALELFKPFVMRQLVDRGFSQNIKNAKRIIEREKPLVWDILEDVIKDHPVLLNRAPTLHRLGIQAFEPVLVEGRAIKLHPIVCSAFNADFDGDQMAVHVPLSVEAQAEARFLMLSTNNILKLSDGKPVVSPTEDMIIGCYYLTQERPGALGEGRFFKSFSEALMAYETKQIHLQAKINVRVEKEIDGVMVRKNLATTIGRFIFNQAIPQDLRLIPRETPESQLDLEVSLSPLVPVGKPQLSQIVDACFKYKGSTTTAQMLDKIKNLGFKYSTIGAITTSVFDMNIPVEKTDYVAEAEEAVLKIEKHFSRGKLTEEERYQQSIKVWQKVKEQIDEKLKGGVLGEFNPLWMMAKSGARGNMGQISQLCGMKGLVRDPGGRIIEQPVKASYREGLSVLEYFISSHGSRKGLADTALKTADSGYLTRRLVDVAHQVIVNEHDCGDAKGMVVKAIKNIESLGDRVDGRFPIEDVLHPVTKAVIAKADEMISADQAAEINSAGVESIRIRSILSCKTLAGICAKCYGKNMASGSNVKLGETVGVIAAQSIGEPGTQLTMRTFQSGGVASADDITQGLPRVEELFEARNPKGEAIIAEFSGRVRIDTDPEKQTRSINIITPDGGEYEYKPMFTQKILVKDGEEVTSGTIMTSGSANPQTLLRTLGVPGVQDYLIAQVQSAYRSSGVEINDKHIEVIVRQMLRKVKIENGGGTDMLPGSLVDINDYEKENEKALDEGNMPANAKRTLLGITKASLATSSFLSAASFQESAKVLTEAAIKNKVDNLVGLKENVIIGKLIPAGTGMKIYRDINVSSTFEPVRKAVESTEHIDQYADVLGEDFDLDLELDV